MFFQARWQALKLCICLWILSLLPAVVFARDCQSGLTSSSATILRIVDGDTVMLANRQKVRLIGLDTREMNASDNQERLWANKATESITKMLAGRDVTLLAGVERKDRHGRLLAHIRLPDGRDVAAELITQGLAISVSVGSNNACADDNLSLELQARSSKRGLWQNKGRWWSDSDARLNTNRGFHVIRSPLLQLSLRGRQTTLLLENGLTIRLSGSWPLNDSQTRHLLEPLEQQTIEVRGWLSGPESAPELRLYHPASLRKVLH